MVLLVGTLLFSLGPILHWKSEPIFSLDAISHSCRTSDLFTDAFAAPLVGGEFFVLCPFCFSWGKRFGFFVVRFDPHLREYTSTVKDDSLLVFRLKN